MFNNKLKGRVTELEEDIKQLNLRIDRLDNRIYNAEDKLIVHNAEKINLDSITQLSEQLVNFLTWHESENLGCLPDGVDGRVDEYLKLITK